MIFFSQVLWSVIKTAKKGYISALACRGMTSINHNWDTGNATPRLSPWTITLQPFIVIKINNLEVPYGRDFLQLQHSRWVESVRRNKAFKRWSRLEYLFIFWLSLGPPVLWLVVFTTQHLCQTERKYSEFMREGCGLRSATPSLLRRQHKRDGSCRWPAPTCPSPFWTWHLSITGSPAPRHWKRKWTRPALSGYPVIWKATQPLWQGTRFYYDFWCLDGLKKLRLSPSTAAGT